MMSIANTAVHGPVNINGNVVITNCVFYNSNVVIKGAATVMNNMFHGNGINTAPIDNEEISLFDWIIKNIRELREKEINEIISK